MSALGPSRVAQVLLDGCPESLHNLIWSPQAAYKRNFLVIDIQLSPDSGKSRDLQFNTVVLHLPGRSSSPSIQDLWKVMTDRMSITFVLETSRSQSNDPNSVSHAHIDDNASTSQSLPSEALEIDPHGKHSFAIMKPKL